MLVRDLEVIFWFVFFFFFSFVSLLFFFFQAEDGIRDLVRSRGLGDVYKRQGKNTPLPACSPLRTVQASFPAHGSSLSAAHLWTGQVTTESDGMGALFKV